MDKDLVPNKRKYVVRILYVLTGASYALLVVLIGMFLLFGFLKITGRNFLLALYLLNIILGILPGLSSNRKQLEEFLVLMFVGSLICSVIGLIIIDWQYGWGGLSVIILYVFLATLEFGIVALVTNLIRLKLKLRE